MAKETILTGLRANNDLHIGNYFGALLPIIDMATQRAGDYNINLFVPDLHSFTTPIEHAGLYDQIIHNLKLFVAAGLPLNKSDIRIYRQSHIPAHSELTWILSCFTGFGEMNRMTQFKDKSTKIGADRVSLGLFSYPVLMAADILLYDATYVPVGDDQSQHLEFTRDIAQRLNSKFGDIFTVPAPANKQHEFFGKDQGLRIRDLIDPTKKMSKSDDSAKGIIFLGDEPADAKTKIMSATTDSLATIQIDWEKQPGITNLLQILSLLKHLSMEEVAKDWQGKSNYGELKQTVANATELFLKDFRAKLAGVDEEQLLKKITEDETQAAITANETLLRVQQVVGLRTK